MTLWNNIHPAQPEERGGGEEMPVIGVNFGEAMLCSGGQVQGVGGAEISSRWGGGEGLGDTVHDGVGQWQEADGTCGTVSVELRSDDASGVSIGEPFAEFPMAYGVKLRPAMKGADEFVSSSSAGGHFAGAGLGLMEFAQILQTPLIS